MKTYKKHSALSQVEYSIDLSQLQLQIINSALSYVDKSIDQEETEVSINIIDICTDIDYNIHNTARLVKVIKSLKDIKMIVDINNKCKIEKKDITLFKNLEVHGFKKGYITFDIPPSFARLNQYSGSSIYNIDTHLQFSSKRVSLLYDYIFDYKNLFQKKLTLDIDVFKKILNITKPMTNIEFNRSLKTYANEIQTLTQLEIKFTTKGFKIEISWEDGKPVKEKKPKKENKKPEINEALMEEAKRITAADLKRGKKIPNPDGYTTSIYNRLEKKTVETKFEKYIRKFDKEYNGSNLQLLIFVDVGGNKFVFHNDMDSMIPFVQYEINKQEKILIKESDFNDMINDGSLTPKIIETPEVMNDILSKSIIKGK